MAARVHVSRLCYIVLDDAQRGTKEFRMFTIANLASGYGQSQILHDLELDVSQREIVAVMGRNGMGKTTLFKTLMGIVGQSAGSVKVDGHEIANLETHQRVERGVGGAHRRTGQQTAQPDRMETTCAHGRSLRII